MRTITVDLIKIDVLSLYSGEKVLLMDVIHTKEENWKENEWNG